MGPNVVILVFWMSFFFCYQALTPQTDIRDWAKNSVVVEESEKIGLKLNIQKTKIMASDPNTSWQIDGKQWKQWQTLFFWAPKSLQMVTETTKLKDACSLEEKICPSHTAY